MCNLNGAAALALHLVQHNGDGRAARLHNGDLQEFAAQVYSQHSCLRCADEGSACKQQHKHCRWCNTNVGTSLGRVLPAHTEVRLITKRKIVLRPMCSVQLAWGQKSHYQEELCAFMRKTETWCTIMHRTVPLLQPMSDHQSRHTMLETCILYGTRTDLSTSLISLCSRLTGLTLHLRLPLIRFVDHLAAFHTVFIRPSFECGTRVGRCCPLMVS